MDVLGEVWSEMRNTYTILSGKVVGRYHLTHQGTDVETELKEIGPEFVDWVHMTQDTSQ
jgi:hypothetical protein